MQQPVSIEHTIVPRPVMPNSSQTRGACITFTPHSIPDWAGGSPPGSTGNTSGPSGWS